MRTIYRYGVFVPSSWQDLGPHAHYSQCADGFDTAEQAEAHAQSFGWIDYTIENYDATDDIALEMFYDSCEPGIVVEEFDTEVHNTTGIEVGETSTRLPILTLKGE